MGKTKIEWTDYTFNPWIGCQKVSAGCAHCYAHRDFKRKPRWATCWGPPATTERIRTSDANWKQPLRWNSQARAAGRRDKVFCASLGDVFEDAPGLQPMREDLWALIDQTPNLDWLLLTKRVENVARFTRSVGWPHNAWLGFTAENQAMLDARVPLALALKVQYRIPVVFVSVEPQLGPIIFNRVDLAHRAIAGISWVIAGGESGPDARPMHPNWARALRDQCVAAGVPFFFKQWGAWWPLHGTGEPTGDEAADPRPFRWVTLDGTVQTSGCAPDALVVKTRKEHVTPLLDGALWRQMPEALRLEGERHD